MTKPDIEMKKPEVFDWFLMLLVIVIGGSSFAMIRIAIETIPPPIITVGRLWVGAIMMTAITLGTGRQFPPLLDPQNPGMTLHLHWRFMIVIGVVGTSVPFFIFPWAQQYVDSGLAGIYMATMPIWTLGLAAIFASEALTGRRLAGFAIGFIGVVILMGPAIISNAGKTNLLAQASLVLATLFYAGNAVITRRAPPIRPRVFSAGALIAGAVIVTPVLFFIDWKINEWSWISFLSMIGLGIFPTGLGALLIVIVIQRVGAGFMAFSNYITPIWAIILGAILFGERLQYTAFIALIVVILGLAVSQSGTRKASTEKL